MKFHFFVKTLSPPVTAIVFARILYAINWFNIASIFYLIVEDFKQDISMLGLISTSFLIGIGIFQVLAGILALKYNPKTIILFGIMLLSISVILSGLTTEIFQMVFLRFLVGTGMAFFFGPSVILISRYLGNGSDGLGIGILNSAHSIGGIIGLFGWIIVAQVIGWRLSLEISGILGCISGLLLFYELEVKEKSKSRRQYSHNTPNKNSKNIKNNNHKIETHNYTGNFRIKIEDLKTILTDKSIINIGLSLLGIQIGWGLISTFTILFLKNELHIDPIFAGSFVCIAMISNVIFAPLFGKLYDYIVKRYKSNISLILLIICNIIISINIFLFSLNNIIILLISVIMIGIFASGGFVVPYAKAREITRLKLGKPPQYETLAVSFVNGLSLSGAFWAPFLFSVMVNYFNYDNAWLFGGFITLVFIIPTIKLLF